jgi:hypothetical protein
MEKHVSISKQKNNRLRRLIIQHKFLTLVSIVILLIIGVSVFDSAKTTYEERQDEEKVKMMRTEITSLHRKFAETVPAVSWADESGCTIIKPRLFGDITRYSCTSEYAGSVVVDSQSDIDSIVAEYQKIIETDSNLYAVEGLHSKLTYTTNSAELQKDIEKSINYAGGVGFLIHGVKKNGQCAILYELNKDKASKTVLDIEVTCNVDSKKAYFEPIDYL